MINKDDLINRVHEESFLSKSVIKQVVDSFLEYLIDAIESGEEIRIYELGTFKTSVRKAHKGYNPTEKKHVMYPEQRRPHIKFNQSITKALQEKAVSDNGNS